MPGSELRVSISITPGSSLKWILSLSHFPDGELEAQVGEAVSPGSYKQTRGPEYSGDSCYLAVGGGGRPFTQAPPSGSFCSGFRGRGLERVASTRVRDGPG